MCSYLHALSLGDKMHFQGAVPRWWRNRTGRPLSPPQIHQKIIWMLSNFHKTTSEYWQSTLGTQKGRPFSSKGGRTKYKRQRDKRIKDGNLSWGGSREGGEVSKQQETLSPAGLWGAPRSLLSPPSTFSSLLNSVNLSGCSRLLRTLKELITG